MGRPELATDERYSTNAKRVANASEVIAIIQAWVDAQPSDEAVLAALEEAHVPCAPILTMGEVVNHPHMQQRGTVRKVVDPKLGEAMLPGMPLRFSDFPHNMPLSASHLGQDNAEVLSKVLGYSADRVATLAASGILHSNPDT